jgi:TP901 family phage tail tape measure protein
LAAALIIPSIFTAIDKLTAPVRAMGRVITKDFAARAETGLNRLDGFTKKLIPGLGEASKQFLAFASTAAITAAIIGGITFSFNAIKEYDKALGSLRAVTGLTGEAFKPFGEEIMRVSKSTLSSSIDVAKAFETIGSANSSLLSSATAMGQMTEAAIVLSQAAGEDLQTTAGNLVGIMNQFGLGADEATRSMNTLAAGTLVGAASIPMVAESMKNFGAVANSANISLEQSVALVEVMGTKSIFGAEAGTKLRGSILKLQQAGAGYASGQFNVNEALTETRHRLDKLKTAKERDALITKMFGAENVTTGQILLSNIGLFKDWTKQVTNTNQATLQAAEKNATLDASLTQLSNAWVTMVTGSNKSTAGVQKLTRIVQWLSVNLDTVVYWTVAFVGAFVALRAVVLAGRLALFLYNVAVGIYNAYATRSLVLTNANTVAQRAFMIASRAGYIALTLVTAAQWLWNAAMSANPIGIIVVGIAAMIALLVLAVKNWNDWGAALSLFLGPLGLVISLVQTFRRNWEMISQAFETGGMLSGLMAIGATLIDVILMPLEQILGIIAKVTGADWAAKAALDLSKFRADMGVNTETDESGAGLNKQYNTQSQKEENMQKMFSESVQRQNTRVTIENQTNSPMTQRSDNSITPVTLSSTLKR